MAYSEAAKKATIKYQRKAYDRMELKVKKGGKAIIKEYADKEGKSINGLINELLEAEIPELKALKEQSN